MVIYLIEHDIAYPSYIKFVEEYRKKIDFNLVFTDLMKKNIEHDDFRLDYTNEINLAILF